MKLHQAGPLLAAVLALCGCAIGNKYDYSDAKTSLTYKGQGRVAVTAWDQRPYVLSGRKDPDYVGSQRNGYGIPFNVDTATGQPLATEMGNALVLTLAGAGFGASPVQVTPQNSETEALRSLLQGQSPRSLLLQVNDWQSDTFHNPTVDYDLVLKVYDRSGHRLATASLKGSDDLQGRLFNPMGKAKETVPALFQQKIQQLLDAPQIQAALR
jgi:hypothetical protein